MPEAPLIDIRPDHWEIVRGILRQHVPQYSVWAFGSRAKWTAKPYSDLDLAIKTDQPLTLAVSAALADAFSESDLPWKVDVVDWATTSESFRKIIERDKVVVQEGPQSLGMAGEWPTVSIEDIAEKIAMGPFGSNIKVETFVETGVPVISGAHLHGVRLEDGDFNFVTDEHAERMKNSNVFRGDVIFTHAGNIGQVAYIPPNSQYERYVISQRQFYLRCDLSKATPAFVSYFFHSSEGQHKLLANASQTGVPSIARPSSYLKTIELSLPSLPEQRAIAHILGSLDDKIELNRRTNATLEAMARALFQSWFVDFEPVRAKMDGRWQRGESLPGLPAHLYDLFPASFQDSDVGHIPYGWRVAQFEEIASVGSGKRPEGRCDVLSPECNIPLYGGGGRMGYVPSALYDKPILFTGRVGTLGTIFRTAEPSWPSDNTLVVEPQAGLFDFTYFVLKRFNLVTLNRGSTQPLLTQTDLKRQLFALPTKTIVKAFAETSEPVFRQIVANETKSRTLATLRDTLLPKLISGELRLPDTERFLLRYT